MPEMSHENVERLVSIFNQLPKGGVCNGVTTLWALSMLVGDDKALKHYRFLRDLNDMYVGDDGILDTDAVLRDYESALEKSSKEEPLTEEDLIALEVKQFSDDVAKFQNFSNLHSLFAELKSQGISVNNAGKTVPRAEYGQYLEAIRLALDEHAAKDGAKAIIVHGIGKHVVGLSTSLEKKAWLLMDTNRSNEKFAYCDSQVLANFLLRYKTGKLFANIVQAEITVFANGEVNELVEKIKAGNIPETSPEETTRPKQVAHAFANQAAQSSSPGVKSVIPEQPESGSRSPKNN